MGHLASRTDLEDHDTPTESQRLAQVTAVRQTSRGRLVARSARMLAVIALIVFGVRRGMMTSSADLEQKQAEKDAIVRMMRQKLLVSPEAVGAELQIDRFRAAALLEELEREGKLVQQRIAGGVAHYRLKGL